MLSCMKRLLMEETFPTATREPYGPAASLRLRRLRAVHSETHANARKETRHMARNTTMKEGEESVSISGRAIAARDAKAALTIGGKTFAVKRQVTLPVLKQEDNAVAFTVLSKMYKGKQLKPKKGEPVMAPATLVRVKDLESGRNMVYVVPAVLASLWRDEYDGTVFPGDDDDLPHGKEGTDTYVGLSFAVQKLERRPGKRHRDLEVVEISTGEE